MVHGVFGVAAIEFIVDVQGSLVVGLLLASVIEVVVDIRVRFQLFSFYVMAVFVLFQHFEHFGGSHLLDEFLLVRRGAHVVLVVEVRVAFATVHRDLVVTPVGVFFVKIIVSFEGLH